MKCEIQQKDTLFVKLATNVACISISKTVVVHQLDAAYLRKQSISYSGIKSSNFETTFLSSQYHWVFYRYRFLLISSLNLDFTCNLQFFLFFFLIFMNIENIYQLLQHTFTIFFLVNPVVFTNNLMCNNQTVAIPIVQPVKCD